MNNTKELRKPENLEFFDKYHDEKFQDLAHSLCFTFVTLVIVVLAPIISEGV